MAPPQLWPPELNEDVTTEILLRISPDEPAHLFRASVVCKLWLRVTSDPAFLRRYRAFHRGAPLLGFFYNLDSSGPFPGFVPTTAASLSPQTGHGDGCVRWVYDCRHGRVLLREIGSRKLVVWDPFSNHCEELEAPGSSWYGFQYNAVVLCAEPGCDHRSCCGGPFHVVCLGIDNSDDTNAHAHVYSLKSRSWCTPASVQLDGTLRFRSVSMKRAALIGDGIYCTGSINDGSLMGMPYRCKNVSVLMENEDGSLGIAGVTAKRLYLWSTRLYHWSTMANSELITGWVQRRVIKLKEILPVNISSARVIGFAEGVEVFLISTNAGAFTFELKSGRVSKVGEPRNYHGGTPFISFFTPDHGCSKWAK